MKTLHLTLAYRWYDMIESKEKTEEYRELKWIGRICRFGKTACGIQCPLNHASCPTVPTDYTHVVFHRGYSKTMMLWSIDNITIDRGNPDWGAPDKEVVIIKLKEREGGDQ